MRVLLLILTALTLLAEPRQSVRIAVWGELNGETPGEFAARVDGAEVKILSKRGPGDDLLLIVVFDLTGDLAAVDMARKALIDAISKLPPNAWVALMRAQDGLRVLVDPTPDRDALGTAIESLSVSGRAGLLETIETASQLGDALLRKASPRLAVYYITDSDVANYREDFTNPVVNASDQRDLSRRFPGALIQEKIFKLEERLAATPVPVFITHLTRRSDPLNEAYQSGLAKLALSTGGQAQFCRSMVEIPAAVERAIAQIAGHWSVELSLAEARRKVIQIEVRNGGKALNYRSRVALRGK